MFYTKSFNFQLAPIFIERTCELALKNQYLLKIHACQRRYQGIVLKKYNIHQAEIILFLEVPQLKQATKDMGISIDQDKKDGPCPIHHLFQRLSNKIPTLQRHYLLLLSMTVKNKGALKNPSILSNPTFLKTPWRILHPFKIIISKTAL